MSKVLRLVAVVLVLCSASSALGGWTFLDSFDRQPANPFDLGSNWTQQTSPSRFQIVNDQASGSGDFNALMTYNGITAKGVRFDVHHSGSTLGDPEHAAAILAFDANASKYLQVWLVDNGIGQFHKLYFCDETGAAWSGMGEDPTVNLSSSSWFQDAEVTVSTDVQASKITVDIDTDFNGTPDLSYFRSNTPMVITEGVGLGAFGFSKTDNFRADITPEPAALLVLGVGTLGLARRRQRR